MACMGASAQAERMFDPRCHFLLEAKVGRYHYNRGGFGMNFVVERELCKYLAWDIASVDFSAPWNCDLVNIGIKTGVKGFSPRFWENRMRVYASVAVGYDCGGLDTGLLSRAVPAFSWASISSWVTTWNTVLRSSTRAASASPTTLSLAGGSELYWETL